MASDKIARAMSVQNGLEITTKIGELSSEIDVNNSVIVETDKYVTSLGNTKDGLLTVNSIKGNTLQNVFPTLSSYKWNTGGGGVFHYTISDTIKLLKPNTVYTYIIVNMPSGINGVYLGNSASTYVLIPKTNNGVSVQKFTSPSTIENVQLYPHFYHSGMQKTPADFANTKFMILEGDWTNKELPAYFEGIKSVGEEKNINILSTGENLFKLGDHSNNNYANGTKINDNELVVVTNQEIPEGTQRVSYSGYYVDNVPSGDYSFSYKAEEEGYTRRKINVYFVREDGSRELITSQGSSIYNFNFTAPYGTKRLLLYFYSNGSTESTKTEGKIRFYDLKITKRESVNTLDFEAYKSSSLSIPLSEPLRSLPNGTKDEIVNGKLIRRVGKAVLTSSTFNTGGTEFATIAYTKLSPPAKTGSIALCSHFAYANPRIPTVPLFSGTSNFGMNFDSKFTDTLTIRNYVDAQNQAGNPVYFYYELETPIETILTPPIPSVKVSKNGTLIINNNIVPTLNVSATSNVSSKVYNIETELTRAVTSNNNAWQTLMILADKELRMKSLSLLTTESTTDLKNKLNEMINIWRS